MRTLYLIDGVAAPKKIWERRKIFGEYIGAQFWSVEIRMAQPQPRGRA